MDVSILIVSHNRKDELSITLSKLVMYVDYSKHEILVFLDGCNDTSIELQKIFPNVVWCSSQEKLGASKARNVLFNKAKGVIFIGFDDDSHPLQSNFISIIKDKFKENNNLGILAFQEIKGVYSSDFEALNMSGFTQVEYETNEFIGCGFAISRDVYLKTNGFPIWLDIYGEEACLSIEVIANGYDILFSNDVKVNHRVNKEIRKNSGHNYFRFGKQLKNNTFYYLVYYKFPFVKIFKLYIHNFTKYCLSDFKYLISFFSTIFIVLLKLPSILKHRRPVCHKVHKKMKLLRPLNY